MIKYIVAIVFCFIVSSCSQGDSFLSIAPDKSEDFKWSIVKSPKTGFCYEIATRAGNGYMGMSRVDCK